jgi:hypothetical protein
MLRLSHHWRPNTPLFCSLFLYPLFLVDFFNLFLSYKLLSSIYLFFFFFFFGNIAR